MFIYLVVLFVFLIYLSAFFSGTETAFVSIRYSRIRDMVESGQKNADIIQKLKDGSHGTITALLIGNNLVNILAASIATLLTFEVLKDFDIPFLGDSAVGIAVSTGVTTFIILVFGEITPKTYAVEKAETIMQRNARALYYFKIAFKPFIFLFEGLSRFILKLRGVDEKQINYTESELKAIVDMSEEEGVIESSERELIHKVLEFDETIAKEVMTPLADVKTLDEEATITDFLNIVTETNFSRIVLHQESAENIVGVVHIKDALPFIKNGDLSVALKEIMRKILFVPSSKRLNSLFHQFKSNKEHIAVVVNEYGNTLGIVTMEDVLEELVGDILDESDDEREEEDIHIINKTTVIARGTADIDEINEIMKINIEQDESFETIAGYIIHHVGHIPKRGFSEDIGIVRITVLDASHKRIDKVKIEHIVPPAVNLEEKPEKSTSKKNGA